MSSKISKAMNTRKPNKPQPLKTQGRNSFATPNTSAASSVSTPSTSTGNRKWRTPDYYGFKSWVCSVSDLKSAPGWKRSWSISPVIETVIQEEASQPPVEETNFVLQEVSPPDSRFRPISIFNSSPDYECDYAKYERKVSMRIFDTETRILTL